MSQPSRERDSGRTEPRPRSRNRRGLFAAAAAVAGHLLVFFVLIGGPKTLA